MLKTAVYDSEVWQLVPKQPTQEMVYSAMQVGIVLNGRPVWKQSADVQAAWNWGQMVNSAPAYPDCAPESDSMEALLLTCIDAKDAELTRAEAVLRDIADACDGSAVAELVGSDPTYVYNLVQAYFSTTDRS